MSATENMTISSSSASSSFPAAHNQHHRSQQQHGKKSKKEILEVKRKAISLLTTAYKTDSDEQVEQLEAQLKDLLLMIRPEDVQGAAMTPKDETDATASSSIAKAPTIPISVSSQPAPAGVILRDFNGEKHNDLDPKLASRVGEIKKPMKQFHAQSGIKDEIVMKKGMVAGMKQEALLEAAMGRKQQNGWMIGSWFGSTNEDDDVSESSTAGLFKKEFGEMGGKELRKHKHKPSPNTRRRKRSSKGNTSISDAFAGMTIVTTKGGVGGTNKSTASSLSSGSFDSEDDVSTLGTEPTYESMSERMVTGFLRVRRLPTTAEEDDDDEGGGGETGDDTLPLQDIAEEEISATAGAADAEAPSWRGWFLRPRAAEQQAPAEEAGDDSRDTSFCKTATPDTKTPPTHAFTTPIHTQ